MERTDFEQWKAKEVARLLALVETERRYYQEMVASLPAALIVLSEDRSIVSANRAFRQTFGLRSEDLRRKTIEQIFPSEPLVERIRDAHLQGKTQANVVLESGERRLRVAIVPMRNWDDESVAETLLMVEDVTGVEAARVTVPAPPAPPAAPDIPAVVWQADSAKLAFTSVSGAAEGLFGYPLAHWRRAEGFFTERIHPEDREATLEFFQATLARGGDATAEYRVRAASGEVLWCRETIRVSESGAAAITGVATDITRRRQLEEQLLTAARAEALQSLAGRLAHDLNNPLMIVNGYGEELLHSLAPEDPLRGDVQQILTAAERITGVTGQLLGYSRRNAEPAEPVDLVKALIDMEPRLAQAAGESVAVAVAEGMSLWVMAHSKQLEEVLLALVSAVSRNVRSDARERNRVTIACAPDLLIELTDHATFKPGAYARLTVHGTGRGVPEDEHAAIFESFLAKDPDSSPGPALARAYWIVREWGGDIAFASEPLRGVTFTIFLPYCEPPAKEPLRPIEQAVEPAAQPAPEAPPAPTILVVEDEAGIRGLVRKILKREGYNVLEAGNGEEAIAIAAAQRVPVDLLVTDVMLPGVGGRELAERIREALPDVKVLYVSGYTDDADVLAAKFPPGARFLQKPFTLSVLVGQVRASLEDQ
jgi:two-component system cell cycle sensor histidine kinase/response regulator CckA